MSNHYLPVFVLASASALAIAALSTEETAGHEIPSPGSPNVSDGLAWVDFDGDGLRDVYVTNPAGEDRLFRGLADGRFEDVTSVTGLSGITGTSVARWADLDADGLPELFLAAVAGSRLLKNNGDGTFVSITERTGLSAALSATDAAWLDYDGDGALDLVVAASMGRVLYHNRGGGTFDEVVLQLPRLVPAGVAGASNDGGPPAGGRPGPGATGPGGPGVLPTADRGGSGGGLAGPTSPPRGGSGPLPPPTPAPGTDWCPETIDDFSNPGVCIPASSVPQLGHLYPLGSDLYIDSATGYVGLGTTSPQMALHVEGDTALGSMLITPGGTNNRSAEIWLAEDRNGTERMGLRYGSSDNKLKVVATNDGGTTEFGPWLTIKRNTGEMVIASDVTMESDVNMLSDAAIVGVLDVETITPGSGVLNLNGRLIAHSDNGLGVLSPTLLAVNDASSGGSALVAQSTSNSGSPTVTIHQLGSGAALSVVQGTNIIFHVNGDGRTGVQTTDPQASLGVKLIPESDTIIRGIDQNDNTVFRVTRTGRTETAAVDIYGGGDLVEGFHASEGAVEPGTVMVIDPAHAGQLTTSTVAYDAKVAGVVSGAGGVRHGIRLGQEGVLDGDTLVAMTGRVYVQCSAENGPIRPGDLLASADLDGHAMRATDAGRSFGAVIGKAMTSLEEGTGLVLVLVSLQ